MPCHLHTQQQRLLYNLNRTREKPAVSIQDKGKTSCFYSGQGKNNCFNSYKQFNDRVNVHYSGENISCVLQIGVANLQFIQDRPEV